MKVYTRTGDDGTTGLFGGRRISKADLRLETYGTIDELNSWLGMLRDAVPDRINEIVVQQEVLFVIGSHLASVPEVVSSLPAFPDTAIKALEESMDLMDKDLPPMRYFVLPGGHPAISTCHVARTVCRRAERLVVALHEAEGVDPFIQQYLNRLSDYLFVLGRHQAHLLGITETPWKPAKTS